MIFYLQKNILMKYNLSIIIAHYFSQQSGMLNPLQKTLTTIQDQVDDFNVEIIIADDGSSYSESIVENYSEKIRIKSDSRDVFYITDEKLSNFTYNNNLNNSLIKKWVYLPKLKKCMSKARVTNYAVNLSESENLLFLDDDNYFISSDSIKNIIELFKKYNFVVGQIKDNNNRLRKYGSYRVQGTTIGMNKKIFLDIGGLGEWTEEFSCGIDSDLWIKIYEYFQLNKNLKACYTNKLSTYDSYSKRWKKYTKFLQDFKLKRKFNTKYRCKNYKNFKLNPSRNKKLWIENKTHE